MGRYDLLNTQQQEAVFQTEGPVLVLAGAGSGKKMCIRDRLSGGQQQRVGLARALAAKPSLMLLDEPFGAIDAINRTKLQDELMKIHKRAGLTCMFVTHDVTEALKLGTRIMIMNQGKIQQFDTAKNILEYPANAYVASLLQSVQEGLNFFR